MFDWILIAAGGERLVARTYPDGYGKTPLAARRRYDHHRDKNMTISNPSIGSAEPCADPNARAVHTTTVTPATPISATVNHRSRKTVKNRRRGDRWLPLDPSHPRTPGAERSPPTASPVMDGSASLRPRPPNRSGLRTLPSPR